MNTTDDAAVLLVTKVFRAMLGREPDAEASGHWVAQIATGRPVGDLIDWLADTEEYSIRHRASAPRSEEEKAEAQRAGLSLVNRTYRAVLGRDPDAEAGPYWASQIVSGRPLGDLIDWLAETEEYRDRHLAPTPRSEEEKAEAKRAALSLVIRTYRAVLGRDPDAEVGPHWASQIVAGRPLADLLDWLAQTEEYRARHRVPLFVPPGHFYSPVCDPAEVEAHLAGLPRPPPDSLPGIPLDRAAMRETWNALLPFLRSAPFGDEARPGLRYRYDNDAYGLGDGSILHAMLRLHRPRRLIEIGSGWSSACTLDTVSRDLADGCALTFIEPYPALLYRLMGEASAPVEVIGAPVQQVPLAPYLTLQAGDVLFIDSTHIVRTGSDVCHLLFEVLPHIVSGVIVHIHDMFWPFEYPAAWAVGENRSWNELYAVRAFLAGNADWEVLFFNDYMAQLERPLIEATWPDFLRSTGGAMWLRRR